MSDHNKRHAEAQNRYIQRKQARRAQFATLKTGPCLDCGGYWPSYAMDWDHVRGEKVLNIAMLMTISVPWAVVLEEIAKCDLVCASCHRVRTHNKIAAHRQAQKS